jgi:two-component system sensor histidine kinase UhpB
MPRSRSTPIPGYKGLPRRNALALRLLHAQEEERRRIARMLHDDLGQTLTAAVLELEYAKAAPDGAEVIDATLIELRRLLGSARDLSLRLRPALIDEEGLEAALGALVSRLSNVRATHVQLRCRLPKAIPAELGLIAFRIVQDAAAALCAPDACFALFVRATPVALRLTIDASSRPDDNATEGSVSIADRAAMVGGSLQIRLLRRGGCRVEVSLPMPRRAAMPARSSKRTR